jgi:phosphatidylserine/phosphatidylglycerophosphate/cardiolipin synthase-like enzyme
VPEPFKPEPAGGSGIRMHHKFVVIDFDKPTARVYLCSYNFSVPADTQNGENLLLIRDRRIAVSCLEPWWAEYYADVSKIRVRELFA